MLVLSSHLFHEKVCKAAAFSIQYNPEGRNKSLFLTFHDTNFSAREQAIFSSVGSCNDFIYIPKGSWV